MKHIVKYNRFFAYSESSDKYFYTAFYDGINIIHGKNTSGKSTLLQAIHYTFGINDEKHKLSEILAENVLFRLDFTLRREALESITIIRDNDSIFVKRGDAPIRKFTGISGNNSEEHRILKHYLAELFGFTLYLESSEYKLASLEALFLPYYVSQDYGWVLALKSFRNLEFFRNFKNDYYDYYLGITNEYDRRRKLDLESRKRIYESEIKLLVETEARKEELKLSKLNDETFMSVASAYIDGYKVNKGDLIHSEKEYLALCNKLTFLEEKLKILKKVKSSLKKQNPIHSNCPTCDQIIPYSISRDYKHLQDLNDTNSQIDEIDKKTDYLKDLKGKINSLRIKIDSGRDAVYRDYSILLKYTVEDLTFSSWLDTKANVRLLNNIVTSWQDHV